MESHLFVMCKNLFLLNTVTSDIWGFRHTEGLNCVVLDCDTV
jgi:hypothetical protein